MIGKLKIYLLGAWAILSAIGLAILKFVLHENRQLKHEVKIHEKKDDIQDKQVKSKTKVLKEEQKSINEKTTNKPISIDDLNRL